MTSWSPRHYCWIWEILPENSLIRCGSKPQFLSRTELFFIFLILSVLSLSCSYVTDFRNGSRPMNESSVTIHTEDAVKNPLATFRLLYRIGNFLTWNNSIVIQGSYYLNLCNRTKRLFVQCELGFENNWIILGLSLSKMKKEIRYKMANLKEDLIDAADAVLRIQFMYNLNASDVRQ